MGRRFPWTSDENLRDAAGPAAFGRGVAYHAQGRVEIISCGPAQVLARVRGTHDYRVELRPEAGDIGGECTCPAFENWDFCKHMVAVALAAREDDGGPAAQDRLTSLRAWLLTQNVAVLADRIMRFAEQDFAILEDLERDALDSGADDDALIASYRSAIDDATDVSGLIDWRGAGAFAHGVSEILVRLEGLLASGRAAPVLQLAEHLLDALDEAFEGVDDSDGEVGGVAFRAAALHLEACRLTRPDPVALADWLFERELSDGWPVFENAWRSYAEVLGAVGLDKYRLSAEQAWAKRGAERSYGLRAILDGFAQDRGDVDARIALRKVDLSSPYAYLEIADICTAAGRDAEALKWLEEALWIFEDRPDERLTRRAAASLAEAGRQADAEATLWRMFERQPSMALYEELKTLASPEQPPLERAVAVLRRAIDGNGARPRFGSPATLLADLQMAEGLIAEAWATAQTHDIGEARMRSLADASLTSHPDLAMGFFERLAESRILLGGADNYEAAVKFIRRRGEACNDPAAQSAYVAVLATRHKAKRTFVRRLASLA